MADAPKTVTIWDGILDDEPTPDAKTKAIKAAVELNLHKFEQHKEALLDHLRSASRMVRLPGVARPIKKPFNEEQARHRLTRLAQGYFLRQVTTPAAERAAGLRKLAEALGEAGDLAETAKQDHFGSDLFSVWFDEPLREPRGQVTGFDRDDDGSVRIRVEYFTEIDFKEMVARLGDFQAATLRAAKDVPTTAPGPAASLPRGFIRELADVYRKSTGRKEGAGRGPFARFVMKFLTALDPSCGITDESLIDAIKNALRKPRAWRVAAKGRRRSTK